MTHVNAILLRVAPGMPDGVRVDGLAPGLNVLVGPNASGKTTLADVLRWALLGYGISTDYLGELHVTQAAGAPPRRLLLRGGAARWESGEEAEYPGDEGRYQLSLATLLAMTDDDDELVRQIVVELEGGDDVDAAIESLGKPRKHLRTEVQAWEQANRRRAQAEREADERAEDERACEELEAAVAAGDGAADRLALLRDLLSLRASIHDAAAAEVALAIVPPGLVSLPEDAAERLDGAWQRLQHARDAHRRARQAALDAADACVAGIDLGDATLDARVTEADAAAQDEAAAVRDATRATLIANDKETEARRLAHGVVMATALSHDETLALVAAQAEHGDAKTALNALDVALDRRAQQRSLALEAAARAAVLDRDASTYATDTTAAIRAADALREWLVADATREGRASYRHGAFRGPFAFIVVHRGLSLATAGLLLATAALAAAVQAGFVALVLALLAGALAAVVAWSFGLERSDDSANAIAVHASSARQAGANPASWTAEAVQEEMRRVYKVFAAGELAARAAHLRDEHLRQQTSAANLAEVADRDVRARLAVLGLHPGLSELAARDRAQRLAALCTAVVEGARARAEEATLREREAAARRRVTAALAPFSSALGASATATASTTLVATARTVLAQARAARDLAEEARRVLQDRHKSVGEAEQDLVAASSAGQVAVPSDGVAAAAAIQGLRERLARRPEAVALRDTLLGAQGAVAQARARLGYRRDEIAAFGFDTLLSPDASLDELPTADAVEAVISEEKRKIDRARVAGADLGAARERLQQARSGTALADAIAAEQAAIAALIAARDEELTDALARNLVELARRQAAAAAGGRILRDAREWFHKFTRDGYDLEVRAGSELVVRDVYGHHLSPYELSDATRIHLIMALRLASIEANEGDRDPLPICLDEALSTSDPSRFDAVVAALHQVAARGRQVLYLTANPLEAQAFVAAATRAGAPPPPVRHVGRHQHVVVAELPPIAFDPAAPRPDEAPEAWLARLQIPPLQLWQDVGAAHLAWLSDDQPAALHRLALRGVERVDTWRHAVDRGRADIVAILDASTRERLERRIRALQATLLALRVGRGRPVTWADVEESGALTPAFADAIRAVWLESEGDAAAVLGGVSALPRIRAKSVEALEAHLRVVGALVDEAPLATSAVVERAVAAAGDVGVAGLVRRWVLAVLGRRLG